eukprot:COSAG06_NODE_29796_length_550_cov_0.911308_1_plen_159_part_00
MRRPAGTSGEMAWAAAAVGLHRPAARSCRVGRAVAVSGDVDEGGCEYSVRRQLWLCEALEWPADEVRCGKLAKPHGHALSTQCCANRILVNIYQQQQQQPNGQVNKQEDEQVTQQLVASYRCVAVLYCVAVLCCSAVLLCCVAVLCCAVLLCCVPSMT